MELKIIKHGGASKKLKELWSACAIQQRANRAPYYLWARDAKKTKWTEQISIENCKVMELKLVKQDREKKDLVWQQKEVWSAWTSEQNAYTTPWIEQGIQKRLNERAARLQNAVDSALTTAKRRRS